MRAPLVFALIASGLVGCATYRDDLTRVRRAYDQGADERALAVLRATERNAPLLTPAQRTQYAWLRGMTDLRVGYRLEARHWLAVAQALAAENAGALAPDARAQMDAALVELDAVVFDKGYDGLANVYAPGGAQTSAAPKPAAKPPTPDEEP